MDKFKCTYCEKEFTAKSSLTRHTTKSKYCLDIQSKLNVEVVNELKLCKYCHISFSPYNMKKHLMVCKMKIHHDYEEQIRELKIRVQTQDAEIRDLKIKGNLYCTVYEEQLRNQAKTYEEEITKLREDLNISKGEIKVMKGDHDCLIKLASQSKVTNNTITNNNKILAMNSLDLSHERLCTIIQDELTYNHSVGGQKGIAEFVDKKVLIDDEGKSTYACTDKARRVFKHKDASGNLCIDTEARKLTEAIIEAGIVEQAQKLGLDWCMNDEAKHQFVIDKINEVRQMRRDNSVFSKELSIRKA